MSIAEVLMVSLLGFSIVFFVLLLLMGIVKLLSVVSKAVEGSPAPEAAKSKPAAAQAATSNKVPATGSLGDVQLNNVDDKTAAMLMAIVADELQAPLNELRFISIREVS